MQRINATKIQTENPQGINNGAANNKTARFFIVLKESSLILLPLGFILLYLLFNPVEGPNALPMLEEDVPNLPEMEDEMGENQQINQPELKVEINQNDPKPLPVSDLPALRARRSYFTCRTSIRSRG